jgi:hypothetical protein
LWWEPFRTPLRVGRGYVRNRGGNSPFAGRCAGVRIGPGAAGYDRVGKSGAGLGSSAGMGNSAWGGDGPMIPDGASATKKMNGCLCVRLT